MQMQFNNQTLAIAFGAILAFITSRIFPIIEFSKAKQENEETDK
jgi:hypothetical protein